MNKPTNSSWTTVVRRWQRQRDGLRAPLWTMATVRTTKQSDPKLAAYVSEWVKKAA